MEYFIFAMFLVVIAKIIYNKKKATNDKELN